MEKIDPQQDHERLKPYAPGQKVTFKGKAYTIQRRTTLASGEAAVQHLPDRLVLGVVNQRAVDVEGDEGESWGHTRTGSSRATMLLNAGVPDSGSTRRGTTAFTSG